MTSWKTARVYQAESTKASLKSLIRERCVKNSKTKLKHFFSSLWRHLSFCLQMLLFNTQRLFEHSAWSTHILVEEKWKRIEISDFCHKMPANKRCAFCTDFPKDLDRLLARNWIISSFNSKVEGFEMSKYLRLIKKISWTKKNNLSDNFTVSLFKS